MDAIWSSSRYNEGIPRTLQLIKNKLTSILSKHTNHKTMFEAKLIEGNILKKIVEAIKDVVSDVNIDVSPSGKLSWRILQNFRKEIKFQFRNHCTGILIRLRCDRKIAAQF